MSNPDQLAAIHSSADAWFRWRGAHPTTPIDLSGATITKRSLLHLDLRGADLTHTVLSDLVLEDVNFEGALLAGTKLDRVTINKCNFNRLRCASPPLASESHYDSPVRPSFRGARLNASTFLNAVCHGVDFSNALIEKCDFSGCNLTQARLVDTHLSDCILRNTCIADVQFGRTHLIQLDLSEAWGLENTYHLAPSIVDLTTMRLSRGRISRDFLKGCGLADIELLIAKLYEPELTPTDVTALAYELDTIRGGRPIQVRPLFISYSRADTAFVELLEGQLTKEGIRYWRDVHDLTSGPLDRQIDTAIRLNPTVIVVLSHSSVSSDWVEWEVMRARELEQNSDRSVLCPLALDESWLASSSWSAPLRNQIKKYNVLDFRDWQDFDAFRKQFQKLLTGLRVYYAR